LPFITPPSVGSVRLEDCDVLRLQDARKLHELPRQFNTLSHPTEHLDMPYVLIDTARPHQGWIQHRTNPWMDRWAIMKLRRCCTAPTVPGQFFRLRSRTRHRKSVRRHPKPGFLRLPAGTRKPFESRPSPSGSPSDRWDVRMLPRQDPDLARVRIPARSLELPGLPPDQRRAVRSHDFEADQARQTLQCADDSQDPTGACRAVGCSPSSSRSSFGSAAAPRVTESWCPRHVLVVRVRLCDPCTARARVVGYRIRSDWSWNAFPWLTQQRHKPAVFEDMLARSTVPANRFRRFVGPVAAAG
jgi:hypothetical protein